MNRELKFRAWDGDKMHKVWSLLGTNLCKVPKKSYPYSEDIVVKDIMQYTGIEDSEGVEIFEGDILESVFDNKRNIAPVRFEEGCFIVDTIPLYVEADFTCKVIGNIYENTDLA